MKEEESSNLPDHKSSSKSSGSSVKPYLAASLEQEKPPREDRPSIFPVYVQLFAAEHGGETEETEE